MLSIYYKFEKIIPETYILKEPNNCVKAAI